MVSVNFLKDFVAGGTSGCIAKCCTAPIERVKLIIQTQDANPKIISGEVPRYTGIGNCFTRIYAEQGPPLYCFSKGLPVLSRPGLIRGSLCKSALVKTSLL